MRAIIFKTKEKGLQFKELPIPHPGVGEILVKIKYAALNHLDLWTWKEQTLVQPVIPGSDGSGVVQDVGFGVNEEWNGQEVIINPSLYWGTNEKVFSDHYQILGNPTNGTFAEYIVIPHEYVFKKPAHLDLKEAAALPLSALTAYRALFTKAQITSSDKILITGIGGGAAHYLLQMAAAIGATIYVTSSSEEKLAKAVHLGAKGGFNYRDKNWVQKAKREAGGFDVIVDSAGGNGFIDLIEVANPAARIILFGRTAGTINNLSPSLIFNKQLKIIGTVMGTLDEFEAMLQFYEKFQLHPVLDKTFSLNDIEEARNYMEGGKHFGKIILKVE